MRPAGLRAHVRPLLACPRCGYGVTIHEEAARCARCGYYREQGVAYCVDLRPTWQDLDPAWTARQALMESWYRDLARDPVGAVDSFQYDYALLRPYLQELEGVVLDIGGGLGIAREYLPASAQYLVVEPSVSWLTEDWSFLHDAFPRLREDGDVIIGVGEHLPLRSDSIDAALALWSLNHTTDPGRVLAEAHRVLRPRGRFLVMLEDVVATPVDLDEHPHLGGQAETARVQDDHIPIPESRLRDFIQDRFLVVNRTWVQHYLLVELERTAGNPIIVAAAPAISDPAPQLAWWSEWFASRGRGWPSDFEARLSPATPVQSRIAAHFPETGAVRILDVGSGPLSRVGRAHPSVSVHVTAVDPLADEYRALLLAHTGDASMAPVRGEAEALDRVFKPSSFDLVTMENALDHCRDPLLAIRQMLAVVEPGGVILLLHEENEADAQRYEGGARWNLTEAGGRVLAWNREAMLDITTELTGSVEVSVNRPPEAGYRQPLEVCLRKTADANPPLPAAEFPAALPSRKSGGNLTSIAWTLIRTDFKIRYHGSAGGFVWALLRPLSLFLVLQTVFSVIFPTDARYRLNLIVGLFLWEFFVESTRAGLGSLAAKAHLLTKVRVPAWLLVVCSTANALLMLSIFVAIIMATLVASGVVPGAVHVALFFTYLVQFYAIILGFGLASSVLFLRFRDVNQLWDLVTQVGFFAAPIIYPLAIVPERFHVYFYLWAPTPVIQFSRDVLVAGVLPTVKAHLLLLAASLASLLVGWAVFQRHQRRVVEYL